MFFLPQKYINIVSERRKYYECKKEGKLDFFAFKASLFYIVVLFIPLSLLLANVISLLLPIDMFYLYGIIDLCIFLFLTSLPSPLKGRSQLVVW